MMTENEMEVWGTRDSAFVGSRSVSDKHGRMDNEVLG